MVAERLVDAAAVLLLLVDTLWPVFVTLGVLSILWIGVRWSWGVAESHTAHRWEKLVRKVNRIRKLRRIWASLGHHLQQWRTLKDKEQ